MRRKYSLILILLGSLILIACGGDSGSSAEEDISSSSGKTAEEFAARCYDNFGIEETDSWSASLSDNDFIADIVCERISELLSYSLSFYARCTSAEYNESQKRFNVSIITERKYMYIWADVSGCSYKIGSDGDLMPLVEDTGEWTFDECVCKEEEGKFLYREVLPDESEGSSSSMEESSDDEDYSSSDGARSSAESSSSSDRVRSSAEGSSSSGNVYSSAEEGRHDKSSSSSKDSITKACDNCNAIKDKRDGNIYRVTEIGGMIWMAEDLRYYSSDMQLSSQVWCSDENGCKTRGYLYSFGAAMNNRACAYGSSCGDNILYPYRGVCPTGFHIPENREWKQLQTYLRDNIGNNEFFLKSYEGWSIPGRDIYGFSAVPTGESNGSVVKMDEYARYWSSTESDANSAYEWYLGNSLGLTSQTYGKNYGYAVRCLADGNVTVTEVKESLAPLSSSSLQESSSSLLEESSSSQESSSSVASSSSESSTSSSSVAGGTYEMTQEPGCENCNAIRDSRDGVVYRVARISGEIWIVDDLRYAGSKENPLVGAMCPDDENCTQRGRLYTFEAAEKACPEGWTLPSNLQMKKVFDGFAHEATAMCEDETLWGFSCTNKSGFAAVPTGEWGDNGYKEDEYARYWTSTFVNDVDAYMWYFSRSSYSNQTYKKSFGYAVRCIATADVLLDEVVE